MKELAPRSFCLVLLCGKWMSPALVKFSTGRRVPLPSRSSELPHTERLCSPGKGSRPTCLCLGKSRGPAGVDHSPGNTVFPSFMHDCDFLSELQVSVSVGRDSRDARGSAFYLSFKLQHTLTWILCALFFKKKKTCKYERWNGTIIARVTGLHDFLHLL